MGKNKNVWIAVIALVIIALIGWYLSSSYKDSSENEKVPEVVIPDSTEDTGADVNTTTKPVSISYADALIKYKDARLQLDKACQASPDKMTFKNNSSLMVDNRSGVARTVKIGSTFSIKAYGFKIIKLSSAKLPTTWYVDCGTSQNVSTITLQK